MKNMIKKIIIGVIIGLVLMACRKYLFINASALSVDGVDIRTPSWTTVSSNYNNSLIRVWAKDIYPDLATWSLAAVKNKYVYISFCTDMPSLGYGKTSMWNSTTGSYATGEDMKLAGNLTSKTCTFSNGYQGHVMYIKFRLVISLLNVGNSDYTYPLNDYISFNIGTREKYSITAQSVVATDDDVDIYSSDFNMDAMVAAQNVTNQAINNTTNAVNNNTNAINNVNNTISDSSVDDPTNDINNMSNKVANNGTITQLLTLPIQLYQNILNSVNGSCNSFNLGNLLGTSLLLPCINLQRLLGSTLFGIIDILCSGLFILAFRKKMVDIFNHMTSLNDRGNELE